MKVSGKYISNSIIGQINQDYQVEISKNDFLKCFKEIQKKLPYFYSKYPKNRPYEFLNCMKFCLSQIKPNGHSKEEILLIHQRALQLALKFIFTNKFKHSRPYTYEAQVKAIISLSEGNHKIISLNGSISQQKNRLKFLQEEIIC